ncbi:MAG: ribosomal protein S18-alanine N-acetyltransferase [Clostridia bacterium]|nr:ribosomal protein S18-alanine N-acetyltransferase [Clostridia bacterium]
MIEVVEITDSDLIILEKRLDDFDDFWNFNVVKSEFENEDSCLFIAKENDEIVGFFGLKYGPFDIDIMNIVVRRDKRNKKIGSLLMEKILEIYEKSDKESITLEVSEENIPAIKLYEKYGFEKVGIRKKYYGNKDAILMKKS